jgi:hypothetical protein
MEKDLLDYDESLNCYSEDLLEDGKISKSFLCPINFGILNNPVIDSCGHTYCLHCIQSWVAIGGKKTCPLTGLVMDCRNFLPNLALASVIDEFKAKCLHHKSGCDWKGTLGGLAHHLGSACSVVRVKCKFEGCSSIFERKQIEEHQQNCEFRLVPCEHCKIELPFCYMAAHISTCAYFPIMCDQDCGINVARCKFLHHKLEDCPNSLVACPFANMGCSIQIKRKEIKEHIEGGTIQHLFVFQGKMAELMRENEALKTQLQAIKSGNSVEDDALTKKVERFVMGCSALQKSCSGCYVQALSLMKSKNEFNQDEYLCFKCCSKQGNMDHIDLL